MELGLEAVVKESLAEELAFEELEAGTAAAAFLDEDVACFFDADGPSAKAAVAKNSTATSMIPTREVGTLIASS